MEASDVQQNDRLLSRAAPVAKPASRSGSTPRRRLPTCSGCRRAAWWATTAVAGADRFHCSSRLPLLWLLRTRSLHIEERRDQGHI
jgi:hypothetical protein